MQSRELTTAQAEGQGPKPEGQHGAGRTLGEVVSRELALLSWQDQPSSSGSFMGLPVDMAPAGGPIWPSLHGVAAEARGAESVSVKKGRERRTNGCPGGNTWVGTGLEKGAAQNKPRPSGEKQGCQAREGPGREGF